MATTIERLVKCQTDRYDRTRPPEIPGGKRELTEQTSISLETGLELSGAILQNITPLVSKLKETNQEIKKKLVI
jgi:hypothetical protein